MLLASNGLSLKLAEYWKGNSIVLRSVSAHEAESGLPELAAPAAQLLTNYLARFSLAFETNEKGEIKPKLKPRFETIKVENDTNRKPGLPEK